MRRGFASDAAAAMEGSLRSVWRSRWATRGGGSAVTAPTAPPTLKKKPVLMRSVSSATRAKAVPAEPERSSCVAVHAIWPTERRRVQTPAATRRHTSGFTRTQLALCGRRAKPAVERTNDAEMANHKKS